MSALSKLRTTKRPRCAGGTGGAVGGGGGGGAGAASGGGVGEGGIVRGPTETGGTAGSPGSAGAGGVIVTDVGPVAAGGGRRCEAHPAVKTTSNRLATRRFILLARRRQRLARRVPRNWRHPASEARRGPPKGNRARLGLCRLLDRGRWRHGLARWQRTPRRAERARRLRRARHRDEALVRQLAPGLRLDDKTVKSGDAPTRAAAKNSVVWLVGKTLAKQQKLLEKLVAAQLGNGK